MSQPSNKTVLVLGAKGRFGRQAAIAFAQQGWTVKGFARNWDSFNEDLDHRVQRIDGDGFSAASIRAAATEADMVVHAMNAPYDKWDTQFKAMNDAVIEALIGSNKTVLIPGNVYNFGTSMPEVLTNDTPQTASTNKGMFRVAMEADFERAANHGLQTIVLRGGDFLDNVHTGSWFDAHMTKDLPKGTFMYPGPLGLKHAWAFLPDMAEAMVQLAAKADTLGMFESIGFEGYGITGQELVDALERVQGRSLRVTSLPWIVLRLMSPVQPIMREVLEMKYLWDTPHRIDGSRFAEVLPDFTPTRLEDALALCLKGLVPEVALKPAFATA